LKSYESTVTLRNTLYVKNEKNLARYQLTSPCNEPSEKKQEKESPLPTNKLLIAVGAKTENIMK